MTSRHASTGLGLGLIAAACFSLSGSFARSLTEAGWSVGAVVTTRVGIAALVLAVPALVALRGRWGLMRRNVPAIGLYGLLTIAGCQVFYVNAVAHLSVGVALLLEYLGIVLVVGWMWIRRGHRPRRLTALGSIVALVGLVLVIDAFGDARVDAVGVLWALAAAVGLATFFILSSSADNLLPPVAFAGAGMMTGAVALLALGALGLLPLHATFGTVELAHARTHWLVPVGGLSVVAAAIAYVAGIGAARRLGPRLAAFVGLSEVIFAVVAAWLLLGELLTATQLVGGALIVTGVALVRAAEPAGSGAACVPDPR
jgi:drug/metabolite transporter (DMT)-like permease